MSAHCCSCRVWMQVPESPWCRSRHTPRSGASAPAFAQRTSCLPPGQRDCRTGCAGHKTGFLQNLAQAKLFRDFTFNEKNIGSRTGCVGAAFTCLQFRLRSGLLGGPGRRSLPVEKGDIPEPIPFRHRGLFPPVHSERDPARNPAVRKVQPENELAGKCPSREAKVVTGKAVQNRIELS